MDLVRFKKSFLIFNFFYWNLTLASRPRIGPPVGAPNSTSSDHVKPCIFGSKNSYHQIGPTSRCEGVGTDFNLLANHKWGLEPLTQWIGMASRCKTALKATLHLEIRPFPLEADCTKFEHFLGWRLASTTHYNEIIMRANFAIRKGLRAKKPSRFNKYNKISTLFLYFHCHLYKMDRWRRKTLVAFVFFMAMWHVMWLLQFYIKLLCINVMLSW
jgi:hypothetical protein